ncbi:MAG: IS110 family transposase [candidate division Zixibacteria bacterium]|nr:IS110 family transposase [candidate division Zixibacteria bacterium]
MSKEVFYVGVDVGSREVWAALAGEKPRRFSHSDSGLQAPHSWAVKRSTATVIHFCLEGNGVYSVSVAGRWVGLANTEVSIVNPAQINAFAKTQLRRCKTDQIDAEVIRAFAVSQHPPLWQPASKSLRQLYELVQLADQLRAQLRQWQNRKHARHYVADLPETVAKTHQTIIRSTKHQLEKVEQAIKAFCAADADLAQQIALLTTIPGIAQRSATQMLAYGQNWFTSKGAKALVAHSGLAPHPRQSGTSLNSTGSIDKRGNQRLRKALYMPTLVAVRHNPLLKAFYQRLCQRGKPKMVALLACSRKLLLIVRAILKSKKPFDLKKAA